MLVVEPDRRLSLTQISKHRWLGNTISVDTGPEKELLPLNKTVIDHMLQLPGLNQTMILQSIQNNSFDHIYAIYNLLVDKLHQRTVNFQTKLSQRQQQQHEQNHPQQQQEQHQQHLNHETDNDDTNKRQIECNSDNEYMRTHRINERSESFDETLVTHLNSSDFNNTKGNSSVSHAHTNGNN